MSKPRRGSLDAQRTAPTSPAAEGKPLLPDPEDEKGKKPMVVTRDSRAATVAAPTSAPIIEEAAAAAAATPPQSADESTLHCRILILGPPGSGRRALMRRFLNGKFGEEAGTKDSARKAVALAPVGKSKVKRLADVEMAAVTGTLESGVLDSFIRMSDAYALTFAMDDAASLEAARQWHARIQVVRGVGRKFRCALVGCKSDAKHAMASSTINAMAHELELPVIETSAKTGHNVDKAFHGLLASCDAAERKEQEKQQQQQQKQKKAGTAAAAAATSSSKKQSWLASLLSKRSGGSATTATLLQDGTPPPGSVAVVVKAKPISDEELLGIVTV